MSVIGTLFVFSLVETTIIFKAFISSIKIGHIIIVSTMYVLLKYFFSSFSTLIIDFFGIYTHHKIHIFTKKHLLK